jgi:hypothetical protein
VKKRPRKTKRDLVLNPGLLIHLLKLSGASDARVKPCDAAVINDINGLNKGKPPGKGGKKPGGYR